MTSIPGFVSGWVKDPKRVQDSISESIAAGQAVTAAAFVARYAPSINGAFRRAVASGAKGVFLRDNELKRRDKSGQPINQYRRPFLQESGTCVARGMARGVQTSLDTSLFRSLSLLKPIEVAWAPIYSMARHEIGRDRCGAGDGAILADAAQAVHDLGVSTSDLFAGMDERSVELLAVRRAAPGVGTPAEWMSASQGHVCRRCWVDSLEFLLDCLTEGYAVPYAHSYVTGSKVVNGMADLGTYGPHCRCFTGWCLDENGDPQLDSSESWGRFPAGQTSVEDRTMDIDKIPCVKLRYAGGERWLPPGDVIVPAKRWWEQIKDGGEAWAVSAPIYESASVV